MAQSSYRLHYFGGTSSYSLLVRDTFSNLGSGTALLLKSATRLMKVEGLRRADITRAEMASGALKPLYDR
jgi:hypothetical protein